MKFLEKITGGNNNKKKIENTVFLIVILIITLIIINYIWNGKKEKTNEQNDNSAYDKILANVTKEDLESKEELAQNIEDILSTIKGVGKVKVLLNYSETNSIVPIYDETTTTSSTEEQDTSGGTRNVTQTQSQRDVVFSENSGTKEPVTKKTIMPVIQGAIVTARGAGNATVKTNIINALQALTGLSADKIQVFEMEN